MAIQLLSNLKVIKSGNAPTTSNLPEGYMAFGKITADGNYHIFGNSDGTVVDLILSNIPMSVVQEMGDSTTDVMSQNAVSELIRGILDDLAELPSTFVETVTGNNGVTASTTDGDVTVGLATIANNTVLGNVSGGTAVPTAVGKAALLSMLNVADGAEVNTIVSVSLNGTTVTPDGSRNVALAGVEMTANKNQANGYAGLDANTKILVSQLPDYILGQMLYGGLFDADQAEATLTTNAQSKLGTSDATIVLTDDDTPITGFEANEGIFYITEVAGTFAGIDYNVGDWLVSTGSGWGIVKNSDAVTSVNGAIGNVTITGTSPIVVTGTVISHASQSITTTPNTPVDVEFGGTFTAVGSASGNATGHVSAIQPTVFTMPSETELSLVDEGTGNVVTGIAVDDHEITLSRDTVVSNATHTGDVTGATALTIAAGAVTNAKMANMADGTIKGNNSGSAGAPIDLTIAQVKTMLDLVDDGDGSLVLSDDGSYVSITLAIGQI